MNDDKVRPVLSLKRKAPSADTSVPAYEARADITVSRRKKVVVNTGPKRNKKPLPDDRHPPPRDASAGQRATDKNKEKKSACAFTQKGGEGNTPTSEEKNASRSFSTVDVPGGRCAEAE